MVLFRMLGFERMMSKLNRVDSICRINLSAATENNFIKYTHEKTVTNLCNTIQYIHLLIYLYKQVCTYPKDPGRICIYHSINTFSS